MLTKQLKDSIYVHHIVLTVVSLSVTKVFYSKIFGETAYEDAESVMYSVGKTKLFFVQQQDKMISSKFNPQQIGLEHLAFGVESIEQLQKIEVGLTKNKIKHSKIHIDKHSQREKIWLDDPSGIRIEFFL